MAQFSYEDFLKKEQSRPSGNYERGNITFLSTLLKNDGDSVLVRFPYKSVNDFTFYTLHNVTVDGKYRNVLCLRNDNDPINACPLCASGDKTKDRILIKCIAYIQGDSGIEVKNCVWDRPANFARTLAECFNSGFIDNVFKITRIGAAKSANTTYTVTPTSPQIYNEKTYPVDFSGFDNYKFNNHIFLDRNYDELMQFVQTGVMPQRQKQENNQAPVQNQQQFGVVKPIEEHTNNYSTMNTAPYTQQPNFTQAESNPFPTPNGYNWQQPTQQAVNNTQSNGGGQVENATPNNGQNKRQYY